MKRYCSLYEVIYHWLFFVILSNVLLIILCYLPYAIIGYFYKVLLLFLVIYQRLILIVVGYLIASYF